MMYAHAVSADLLYEMYSICRTYVDLAQYHEQSVLITDDRSYET
jgi:hypothetical protein